MVMTVAAVTAIALGAAFAAVTTAFVVAQLRQADANLLRFARLEARELDRHRLSFSETGGPAEADVGPMVMSGVLYDSEGKIVDATKPFEQSRPDLRDLQAHSEDQPFDFRFRGTHFRGVLIRPNGHLAMTMLIAESRESLDADMRFLVQAVVVAFVLAVVWAAAVATWRARALTQEQRAIAATVRRFAEGELAARVHLRSSDPESVQLAADIDEMAAQIQKLVDSRDRFVAHAAHELRSPLTKLYGELQLALRKERTADEYRRAIAEAEGATKRLMTLAEDLLALVRAREDAGAESEVTSVSDLAREAASLAPHVDASRLDLAGEPLEVRGRRADLARLLRNLLENAFTHGPGGRVRVSWGPAGGDAEIRVSDEGSPISIDVAERLFEPFYRARRDRAGSGLGLGIAREIARAHGGDVRLEPTRAGVTFRVRLPRGNTPEPRGNPPRPGARAAEKA